MAAVTYTAGTIRDNSTTADAAIIMWLSPSSMDSADTVVIPTITGKTVQIISCWDQTTGDGVTASLSTQTVTIDAAGGTTNHAYLLVYTYI
jgi:hypothetical protein